MPRHAGSAARGRDRRHRRRVLCWPRRGSFGLRLRLGVVPPGSRPWCSSKWRRRRAAGRPRDHAARRKMVAGSKVSTRRATTYSSPGSWWAPIFLWRASWWSPTSASAAMESADLLAVSGLDTFTYWLGNWLGDALVLAGGSVCVVFMLVARGWHIASGSYAADADLRAAPAVRSEGGSGPQALQREQMGLATAFHDRYPGGFEEDQNGHWSSCPTMPPSVVLEASGINTAGISAITRPSRRPPLDGALAVVVDFTAALPLGGRRPRLSRARATRRSSRSRRPHFHRVVGGAAPAGRTAVVGPTSTRNKPYTCLMCRQSLTSKRNALRQPVFVVLSYWPSILSLRSCAYFSNSGPGPYVPSPRTRLSPPRQGGRDLRLLCTSYFMKE